MDSSYQQQEYLGSSFFQPIHSDLSYESYEEEPTFAQECFNKSIFRQPDDGDGDQSPPTVSRANPIGMDEDDEYSCCEQDEEMYNIISPYPYETCQEELEDRQDLVSEMPQLGALSGDPIDSEPINYSFYFQPKFDSSSRSVWEDGIAPSNSTQTESCAVEQRRTASPAQISDTDSMGEGN